MTPPTSLKIESVAAGGDGVGHIGTKVCFVPFSAPGDTVRIDITKKNRNFLRGRIREIVTPGPGRQKPSCPLFGICGGCKWLHLSTDTQHAAKQQILARALRMPDVPLFPSDNALAYRSVARLHIGISDEGRSVTGFVNAASKQVVPIDTCPVLAPALNRALPALHRLSRATGATSGEIRLVLGDDGPVACFYSDTSFAQPFYDLAREAVPHRLAGVFGSADGIDAAIAGRIDISTTGTDGRRFIAPARSFGQTNRGINQTISDTLREWLGDCRFKSGIELFAGAGNHTVTIAPHVDKLTASEIDDEAVSAMKKNLEVRGYRHVDAQTGEALKIYKKAGGDAALVLLNPPRTGHLELAHAIAEGDHRIVIYISCNPATLSRDLVPLYQQGFALDRAAGFDMFPQTPHLEAAVMLKRV